MTSSSEVINFVDMSIIDKKIEDLELSQVVFFQAERMMRRAKELTKVAFKEHNFKVTLDQWLVLKKTSEFDGISQIEIANSTFKDPAAVTRILDILVRKKLVTRTARPEDRRTHEILLTEAGIDLVRRMTPVVQGLRAKALKGFSAEEIEQLRSSLSRAYDNLAE